LRGRWRWLLVPLVIVPLGWLFAQGFARDPRAIPTALAGKPVPAFQLATLDGSRLAASDLRGRPVILNFWASWCGPCVAEHRVLADALERHGDAIAIVGVLYQDELRDALRFLARYGDFGWPNVIDERGGLAIEFGVTGPPETYFIDADGIVRDKQFGPVTTHSLTEKLEPLVARASR
jgi:cytochrome c biogenesis protein CcmG, thiol:disulfide interchange protein DsbE